jgi:K+-transporting ATPase A subunit
MRSFAEVLGAIVVAGVGVATLGVFVFLPLFVTMLIVARRERIGSGRLEPHWAWRTLAVVALITPAMFLFGP